MLKSTGSAQLFIFITVLIDMMGFGIIIPVLPNLISEVAQVGTSQAAVIGAAMFFVYSAAQFASGPLLGNLSDAYGRRPLLLFSVFGLGIDFIVAAVAPTVAWLFAARLLSGVCGASSTIANAYVTDINKPEDRARAFGMIGAAFGLGFVLGPIIGGVAAYWGTRVPFFVAAFLSLSNFLFGYFALPETLAPENRRPFDWRRSNPFGIFAVFARYQNVLALCAVMGLMLFATAVYPAIWAFWSKARFGWSPQLIGVTLAAFGIIMAITQGVLTGPLVKWLGEYRLTLISFAASIVALLLIAVAPNIWVVLAIFIIHAPEGFINPMLAALMSKEVPENAQGELQGGLASLANVSMMFGTLFYGWAFAYFLADNPIWVSPSASFIIAAILMTCSACLLLLLHPAPKKD